MPDNTFRSYPKSEKNFQRISILDVNLFPDYDKDTTETLHFYIFNISLSIDKSTCITQWPFHCHFPVFLFFFWLWSHRGAVDARFWTMAIMFSVCLYFVGFFVWYFLCYYLGFLDWTWSFWVSLSQFSLSIVNYN